MQASPCQGRGGALPVGFGNVNLFGFCAWRNPGPTRQASLIPEAKHTNASRCAYWMWRGMSEASSFLWQKLGFNAHFL